MNELGYSVYNLPGLGSMILAYPVVTMGKYTHKGSRNNFLGKENRDNSELIKMYSVEEQISDMYPPSFVWQCERDNQMPIENTQMLVQKLKEHNVSYEYKTSDSDAHGWGIATGTSAEGWLEEAISFWKNSIKK
ncbi:alpha/beta hydrolase family protein [Alloscardovia omnicolens]|uniref:alpha/beta hydrolase family protein n=1 Tax=Alloscardovia omnicolens TaxID=419015 RepID=UPI003A615F03